MPTRHGDGRGELHSECLCESAEFDRCLSKNDNWPAGREAGKLWRITGTISFPNFATRTQET